MKIELKNIKFSEAMSEETSAFTADIYVDGKKVGYAKNTGQGGPTDYLHYSDEKDSNREILGKAEKYCESLPEIVYGTFSVKSDLENVIDNLFEDWMKKKDEKKMEKQFNSKICVGIPNGNKYACYDLKKPLETFPKEKLQAYILQIKSKLKVGEVILNTNLEKLGIKI